MTALQKAIKYIAMAFAIFLVVSILGGIISAVAAIGGVVGGVGVLSEAKTYEVSQSVDNLEVKIAAGDFKIVDGDGFSVESNIENLTVKCDNGTLKIEQKKEFAVNYNKAFLTLIIPKNLCLKSADISTGAGKMTVDSISAQTLCLELGAGEVNIESLNAETQAKISGGAGEVNIDGGALNNLSLSIGVGELNLTSRLSGDCKLNCGVGETTLDLLGNREDYTVTVKKGIGEATLDGVPTSGTSGTGATKVSVDGGIGAIKIRFKDADEK